ncbi:hypothetical protein ACYOEI_21745 [Singulisphaera rosea]
MAALLSLTSLAGGSIAATPTPADVLRERGLTKSGAYFVVASESNVFAAVKRIRPAMVRMTSTGDKIIDNMVVEANFQEADDMRIALEGQIRIFDMEIPRLPRQTYEQKLYVEEAMAERNATQENLVYVNAQLNMLRKRRLSAQQVEKLNTDFEKHKVAFVREREEMQPVVDNTMSEYSELNADTAVRNALNAFGTMNKFKAKLGPSPAMVKSVGGLKDVERAYSPETAPDRVKSKRKSRLKVKSKAVASRNSG